MRNLFYVNKERVRINRQNKDKALHALKNWWDKHESFYGKCTIADAKSLSEALCKLGWDAEKDDIGNIKSIYYSGDHIVRDEDNMFAAIAPFVKSGSYIKCCVYENSSKKWIWKFRKGKLIRDGVNHVSNFPRRRRCQTECQPG